MLDSDCDLPTKLGLPGVVVDDGLERLDQGFKHAFPLCVDHGDPSQLQATQSVDLTHQITEGLALSMKLAHCLFV